MIRYWEEDTETEIGRPFDLEKHDKEISDKWINKVKKAREEIENEIKFWSEPSKYNVKPVIAIQKAKEQSYKHCLEILDNLIADADKMIEPTTKNNLAVDCVSRKAVLDMAKSYNTDGYDMYTPLVVDVEDIEELPPVTLQPKTGHWIGHREHCENLGVMPSGLGAYEWCSNCDCGIDVREWHRNHYNYCPNCGADMKGEEYSTIYLHR